MIRRFEHGHQAAPATRLRWVTIPAWSLEVATREWNKGAGPVERDQAVERALSRVGERRYSLGGWNCEHFASWCATGEARSQQVINVMTAFLVFLKSVVIADAAVLAVIALKAVFAE